MPVDLSNWIGQLSSGTKEKTSIFELIIPGSHNSFTDSLDRSSAVAGDQSGTVKCLAGTFPCCVKGIIDR